MKKIIFSILVCYSFTIIADTYEVDGNNKLYIKISKSGLNRISNPPYKIMQVTGDETKFRLKYDEDGANIYLMPLSSIGQNIEISIKNNIGFVQDLDLEVSNIKEKSITIQNKINIEKDSIEKQDISEMLRAMKDDIDGKFYVQETNQKINIDILKVNQKKIYKYKNLVGGVFEIKNPSKKDLKIDIAKDFENVKNVYPQISIIKAKSKITVFIVQKIEEV